jgi:hypothetical protein
MGGGTIVPVLEAVQKNTLSPRTVGGGAVVVGGGAGLFQRKEGKSEATFFFLSYYPPPANWKKEKIVSQEKKDRCLLLLLFVDFCCQPHLPCFRNVIIMFFTKKIVETNKKIFFSKS